MRLVTLKLISSHVTLILTSNLPELDSVMHWCLALRRRAPGPVRARHRLYWGWSYLHSRCCCFHRLLGENKNPFSISPPTQVHKHLPKPPPCDAALEFALLDVMLMPARDENQINEIFPPLFHHKIHHKIYPEMLSAACRTQVHTWPTSKLTVSLRNHWQIFIERKKLEADPCWPDRVTNESISTVAGRDNLYTRFIVLLGLIKGLPTLHTLPITHCRWTTKNVFFSRRSALFKPTPLRTCCAIVMKVAIVRREGFFPLCVKARSEPVRKYLRFTLSLLCFTESDYTPRTRS